MTLPSAAVQVPGHSLRALDLLVNQKINSGGAL